MMTRINTAIWAMWEIFRIASLLLWLYKNTEVYDLFKYLIIFKNDQYQENKYKKHKHCHIGHGITASKDVMEEHGFHGRGGRNTVT